MEIESIGIILAGGIGSRFRADIPKQYCTINGKEMIEYSISAFRRSSVEELVVVADESFEKYVQNKYSVKTVIGGKTRNQSLKNCLDYIKNEFGNCKKIVINNAACPMITCEVIDELISTLDFYDYAQCTYKITDGLCSFSKGPVNRDDFFTVQTPEAFRFDLLYENFSPNNTNCVTSSQLPLEARGLNFFEFLPNVKITYPEDIEIVELLMKRRGY
ncbi:MAG: 2-C-methyl-D-erythritol 4-phosphate cytidylyltransferase [Eubacteriales bacterium]|nr:2-C-methyl-D-erythritol 4-phosphate cytidylyltransferase [Eubacteriales bacterium]